LLIRLGLGRGAVPVKHDHVAFISAVSGMVVVWLDAGWLTEV